MQQAQKVSINGNIQVFAVFLPISFSQTNYAPLLPRKVLPNVIVLEWLQSCKIIYKIKYEGPNQNWVWLSNDDLECIKNSWKPANSSSGFKINSFREVEDKQRFFSFAF